MLASYLDLDHGSWVPCGQRLRLSTRGAYVIFSIGGKLYSVRVELLLELIAGRRDSLRMFVLEKDHV